MAVEARSADPPEVGERLRALLAERAGGAEAAQIATFARLLLLRGGAYVEGLSEEGVGALVASAFRFYSSPGPELRVRAFTPTYAEEGWDAPVSIVETVMPDRPFVVDTIRERLHAEELAPRALIHPILGARRDPTGRLEFLAPPEGEESRESFVHVAIPRVEDAAHLARLAADIQAALADVRLVTGDFPAMIARAQAVAAELDALGRSRTPLATEASTVADFLRWLVDGGFVFLGYREYELVPGAEAAVRLRPGSGLGILRREDASTLGTPRGLDALPEPVRALLAGGRLLAVRKTLALSPVHRRARMDDVTVQARDAEGRVVGDRRFLGLFTSKAYAEEAAEIPLLRRMLRQILAAEHVVRGSHDYKEIVAVFNALPKPTLFASSAADVRATIQAILTAARTEDVVVSVRPQANGEALAVLIVMPRERFSTEAHERIAEVVGARLGGPLLDDHVVLGEGARVLLHFTVAAAPPGPDVAEELRAAVVRLVRRWEEGLRDALVERHGEATGERLADAYAAAFPEDYRAAVVVERAAEDVVLLDAVATDGNARVALRNDAATPATTALRLYIAGEPVVLSEFMPVLEHLGLRALAEDQVSVAPPNRPPLYVQTFVVQDRQGRRLDESAVGVRLIDALLALRAGRVENDVLGRLVLEAGLDWRAVDCLRAYCGYASQIGLAARSVVQGVVAAHPAPARLLFEAFEARFQPGAPATAASVRERFVASLETVQVLREDLCFRALADVVDATVRTNFFTRSPDSDRIALKIHSADLQHLPRPRPRYEIYVHGPGMEGIHLRGGKVARGGIRASDRPEDFRTEILGLMKTQTVKNAVIVPTGAKGGFVSKGRPGERPPVEGYRTLIRGLLDLTDNLIGGRVVHPRDLLIHDEEDPYLVVAADKGTASFSDVANAIAEEYGFWLGDAFASGGSHGYDHKALGITARGAWECVRTHFRELGVDADTAPLTVVGIGDPGGDVFGNGLLRSRHVLLRAAFNHRHVFLDPDPDPARSFTERERLFRAGKGWDAYDPAALSAGGAVLERAAKRVTLSPEARAMLRITDEASSGEAVVRAVLGMEADLLFNGGIGTYVKASTETHADIRDAVNDSVRVDAAALRVKVVAEGGNLGFTQRARIEYALAGGRINTDAIDNSAGVDMSDHEVNLKICLRAAVDTGRLEATARNTLLAEVTDDVVARVLAHNRAQSRLLSLDQARSRSQLSDFRELIAGLEREAGLDRALEALPDRDALRARRGTFLGLTRPELAVVAAYTKIHLQQTLLASPLLDEPLVEPLLVGYFPARVAERFPEAVREHALRRPIIATTLANVLVDTLGTTFVQRVTRDTGASVAEAARAWVVAWTVAGGAGLVDAVAGGDHGVEAESACQLVLERTAERVTKWLLANADPSRSATELAADLGAAVAPVRARLPEWVVGPEAEAFHRLLSELGIAGLPPALAREFATAEWLTGALDVVAVAREVDVGLEEAAGRYYGLADRVDFAWLWTRLGEAGEDDRWQRRAVEGLVVDLLRARRRLARLELRGGEVSPRALAVVEGLLRDLRAAPRTTLAALQVIVREVGRLAESGTGGKGR
jgi:glutamate dehydrogenase